MKNYDRNLIKWIKKIGKRYKVSLFLLVFAAVMFGLYLFLTSLISPLKQL